MWGVCVSVLRDELSKDPAGNGERLAARIMIDSLLRQLAIVGGTHRRDLMLTVVYLAILSANVQHIAPDSAQARARADLDGVTPDAERRPISAHSLALSLSIPYETARRYIGKLLDEGRCIRVRGGVIVPAAYSASEKARESTRQFYAALRRMLVTLRRAGFDLDAMSQG